MDQERRDKLKMLLKAGAAVPIIWTLPSGSVLAASSNSTCASEESELSLRNIVKSDEKSLLTARINGQEHSFTEVGESIYRLDETGQTYVLLHQENGRSGQMISQSCWASISPTASSSSTFY